MQTTKPKRREDDRVRRLEPSHPEHGDDWSETLDTPAEGLPTVDAPQTWSDDDHGE